MKYDHYIALDWAQRNMALAHMTKHSNEIDTIDVDSNIKSLKFYLKNLKGSKILTFEESNPAQWLYTELIESVDKIIVCEPYANHLLKQGPKTDRVDAIKLLKLLRSDMLKPVFHCTDEFIKTRKIVSAYDDLIMSGVQLKNRRLAMFRACGKHPASELETKEEQFVLKCLDTSIELNEELRRKYEAQFRLIHRRNKMVKNLASIQGIGLINAVKLAAIVIDPRRFKHANAFWIYCGLQKYDLTSGGRSYGKRSARHSRELKSVFKTAALCCSRNSGPFKGYYENLIKTKNYPEHQARHALARRIAAIALGVMKSEKPLDEKELSKKTLAS